MLVFLFFAVHPVLPDQGFQFLQGRLGVGFLLPFSLEIRQALAVITLAPIGTAIPPFTAELKEDYGLSGTINSLSVLISIILIPAALLIFS